jgi:hypothetical protein
MFFRRRSKKYGSACVPWLSATFFHSFGWVVFMNANKSAVISPTLLSKAKPLSLT